MTYQDFRSLSRYHTQTLRIRKLLRKRIVTQSGILGTLCYGLFRLMVGAFGVSMTMQQRTSWTAAFLTFLKTRMAWSPVGLQKRSYNLRTFLCPRPHRKA